MNQNFTKLTFTDSVKKVQEQFGSREAYARIEQSGDQYMLTDREIPFIESRDSFYMATVGESGWPYVQYRGGPAGFLKVLDKTKLGFADFRGNMQYISTGNIKASAKASLFLIDYPTQQRLKIWAEAEVVDATDNPDLMQRLANHDYPAQVERLIIFRIKAYDWNCRQHITPRYTAEEIAEGIAQSDATVLAVLHPNGNDKTHTRTRNKTQK